LDDRVTSVEEVRTARLELHSVKNELDTESVTVLGDQRLLDSSSGELLGAIEIALGNGTISERRRRVQAVGVPMLLDKALVDDEKTLGPNFTDGVYAPVTWLVEGLVGGGVDGLVSGVREVPDSTGTVGSPSTHGVVGIVSSAPDDSRQEVSPTFTHTTGLSPSEASRVSRSTSQPRAQAVAQLVDDDTSLKITISVRSSGVPQVHSAASILTIRWCHEVSVVVPATVLSVGNDGVILLSTTTEVVLLEITGNFVEAVTVVKIVDHVGGVEELSNGGVNVLLGLSESVALVGDLGRVLEVELQRLSGIRTVVVNPVVLTFPIFVCEDVVTSSGGGVPEASLGSLLEVGGVGIRE